MNDATTAVTAPDAFADFAAEMTKADEKVAATIVSAEGETHEQLSEAFDSVVNADGWKLPWTSMVHHCYVGRVIRAVEFFHADTPEISGIDQTTGLVELRGNGYQAW